MIRSKSKWACKNCAATYLKWEGVCRTCQNVGSIEQIEVAPVRRNPTPLQRQRAPVDPNKRIRRRAKDSERGIARRMLEADGADPAFSKITSSTGRVGHITGMRIDAISRSYVTENKNRKLPSWLVDAWILINQRGIDFGKNVLLHVDPPNMPKEIIINGSREKLDTLSIITQSRHEELIANERILDELVQQIENSDVYVGLQSTFFTLQARYSKK